MHKFSWFSCVLGLSLAAALFTGPCQAAQAAATELSPAASPQEDFRLVDERPDSDRAMANLSSSVFSCNFMIIAFGDEQAPGRVQRLESDLKGEFGDRLAGHIISVRRYSIYVNAQESGHNFSRSVAVGGALGGAMAQTSAHGSKCPREKMIGGWYMGSEITNDNDPYVAEIEILLDGQPIAARAVHSPAAPPGRCGSYAKKKCYESPKVLEPLSAVQLKANQALAVQIAEALAKP